MTEKEYICRSTFEAQGATVLAFWLDEEGYGTCSVILEGKTTSQVFSQNPKKAEPSAVASYNTAGK